MLEGSTVSWRRISLGKNDGGFVGVKLGSTEGRLASLGFVDIVGMFDGFNVGI